MRFRNAIMAIFGGIKKFVTSTWREVNTYSATFAAFGTDIYANEVARACIRALAEHTSKANVRVLRDGNVIDNRLQRMIQYRPNIYMNGRDFLYKVRTMLELNNIVFIFINRDELGRCIGLYPMPQGNYEAVEYQGGLYIKFSYPNGNIITHSWEDLAVLRKDYNKSDVFSDSNSAILTSLDLLNTTNSGMANAIKSTANLRGILKSTKAMLSPDDAKAQKDRFVLDYLGMENGSGIASLDATQDFVPLNIQPQIADYKNTEELRNNIYRYYGVNEEFVMSKVSGDDWEAIYESRIEGFLLALGLELTNKIFTEREKSYNNEIVFEANRMAYMSMANKLALMQMVDRGAMTPNEWRQVLNLAPIAGGDVPIRRLDTAPTTMTANDTEDDNE